MIGTGLVVVGLMFSLDRQAGLMISTVLDPDKNREAVLTSAGCMKILQPAWSCVAAAVDV